MGVENVRGLVVPLATPLTEDKQLDEQGLISLVDYVLQAEPNAVLVNGGTAECYYLPSSLKNRALDAVVEQLRGRAGVLAHTTANTIEETIANTQYAREHGADAAIIAPLEFHNSNRGLPQAVHAVAEEVGFPLFLYNQPKQRAKVEQLVKGSHRIILPRYFKRILLENTNVVGIKDSSGDPNLFDQYRKAADLRGDRRVVLLQGDESQLATNIGHGAVPSLANVDPKFFRYFYDELKDAHVVLPLQATIIYMGKKIYCGFQKIRGGIKTALSYLGICGKTCAEPGQELTQEEDKIVRATLEEYELTPRTA